MNNNKDFESSEMHEESLIFQEMAEHEEAELNNVIGYHFEPESHQDREYVDLLNYMRAKGVLKEEYIQIALAEYSVSREPIGMILIRNGFLSHKDYITSLIKHSPDAIYNEEMIVDVIDYEFLIETNTMVVAQDEDTLYLSTFSIESVVASHIQELVPNKEIVFLPAIIEKTDFYMNKLRNIAYGESNFLEKIIKNAMKMGASDIHIIPKSESYSIFFRIIGVKSIIHEGSMEEYYTLIARIKDRSKMDLAEKRVPQDGGFQVENNGRLIDMRVATVPTVGGDELTVIRLLDPDSVQPSLDLLGITRIDEWRKGVSHPSGLALICGPTGSGKTTTLQASIREMNRFEKAIFTVEDPVEYRIPYVGQVNINRTVGLDFPNVIRAFMRADPDVIMVGEIRDEETARVAVKGAETGHLVVGTLHTNSIRSTVDRLRDIGISPKEIRYILRTILVQRLVRTLCMSCRGEGCDSCNGQGYSGRTIVSECKYFNNIEEVDDMLAGNVTWASMIDDAIYKVELGETNTAEIIRVFGEEGRLRMIEKGVLPGDKDGDI